MSHNKNNPGFIMYNNFTFYYAELEILPSGIIPSEYWLVKIFKNEFTLNC
jgi:hypothetical protein